ncbi:MAG: lipoprotein [Pseudomonadota bacterium]
MRWFLLVVTLLTLAGCGQKGPPQAGGVSTDLLKVVVLRRDAGGMTEQDAFRAVLLVTNDFGYEITLERVEFIGRVGKKTAPGAVEHLDVALPAGQTTELRLSTVLGWKDDAPMSFERGAMEGTLYYSGPKGKIHGMPFSLSGDLDVRGQ